MIERTIRWWLVPPGLLEDEPARRAWLTHLRARNPEGRWRIRRHEPNAWGIMHGATEPVILVELRVPAAPIQLPEAVPSEACTHNTTATQGGNE